MVGKPTAFKLSLPRVDTVGKPVLGYGPGGRVADDRLGEATYRTGNDRKAMNHASGIGEASRVDGKKLHKLAAARAEELPGAELTHPFGPDWEVIRCGTGCLCYSPPSQGTRSSY